MSALGSNSSPQQPGDSKGNWWNELWKGKEQAAESDATGKTLDALHKSTLASVGVAVTAPKKTSSIGLDPKGEALAPLTSQSLGTAALVGRGEQELVEEQLPSTAKHSKTEMSELVSLLKNGQVSEFNASRPSGTINLQGIELLSVNLKGVDLRGANLTRAVLTGCDLSEALLQNSTLDRADLRRTTLNDTKFYGATLRHCDLSGVVEAKRAQFNDCNMRCADLSNHGNFSGANFNGAKLITATLTDSNFSHCQMVSAWLAGAILTNTSFHRANLHQARLFQSNGKDINFSEANLTQAEANQTHFTSSNEKAAEGKVLKTNFDNAWTMGFQHNGGIPEGLLANAISDRMPEEGQFKTTYEIDVGKRLINGIPGTDQVIYDAALEELDELIGLKEVKQQVKQLTALVESNQARLSMSLPELTCILHRIYLGEPGTGKTTIARIEAKLYYALGLLKKGQVIETDKSGFISGYAGQSLGKTNETIDSAIGGTLIADEIYALTETKNDDYAKDALAVLVKRLWDDRDKFCCIFLGYGDEMQGFINSNKGMKRRIGAIIHFPSYSSGELIDIYKQKMEKKKFSFNQELLAEASILFTTVKLRDEKNFGNAGTVENAIDHLSMRLSCRLKAEKKLRDENAQRNPTIDDLPFERMTGLTRGDLPEISKFKWQDSEGKLLSVNELPLTGEFPNLTEESIELLRQTIADLPAMKVT